MDHPSEDDLLRVQSLREALARLQACGNTLLRNAEVIVALEGEPTEADFELALQSDYMTVDLLPPEMRRALRKAKADGKPPRVSKRARFEKWNWWPNTLRPVRGDLRNWWQAWDKAIEAVDNLPKHLVNDSRKPVSSQFTTLLRNLVKGMPDWLLNTRTDGNSKAGAVSQFVFSSKQRWWEPEWPAQPLQLLVFDRVLRKVEDELKSRRPSRKIAIGRSRRSKKASGRKVRFMEDDDAKLLRNWAGANHQGTPRKDFCRANGITVKELTRTQGRQRYRTSRKADAQQ